MTCPHCETPIEALVARGPSDHVLSPCGCRVTETTARDLAGGADRGRGVVADGGTEAEASLDSARARRKLKLRFEAACDVMVTTEQMVAEEVFACIEAYLDWMQTNLAQDGGQTDPQRFVAWMETADRNPANYPAPRAAHLVEHLDEALIHGVEDDGLQPAVVVEVLDEWVEDSKQEFIERHNVSGDFFEDFEEVDA